MTQRSAYKRLEQRLVIAFDIGTTYSGVSYCILDPGEIPQIHGVTRYPAQEQVGGNSKIPSILYYDVDGQVAAIGAEALSENTIEAAQENGWTKVEWFKLHLRPAPTLPGPRAIIKNSVNAINDDIEIPSLPSNKDVTIVFSDFLQYLFRCTREYIIETHARGPTLWTALERKTHFILSHPNGWEGPQQTLMRRAAILAGLIPDTSEGHARVEFVTEGEASLHYCISSDLVSSVAKSGTGIMIVDAGGGTVDVSTYIMTAPNKYEEIAPPDCIFQGSVYVTKRTESYLRDKFRNAQSDYAAEDYVQEITDCFDKATKLTVVDGEPAFVKFGTLRDKDPSVNIKGGRLRLESGEISTLFQPAVDGIINAIENQRDRASAPVTDVFLVGGFAANNLLFTKLQNHLKDEYINLSRPQNHTNKAVADGAVSYYIDHFVSSRVAKFTYGIETSVRYGSNNTKGLKKRLKNSTRSAEGDIYINGHFQAILQAGTSVSETMEFRSSFSDVDFHPINALSAKIICYRGKSQPVPKWLDQDSKKFQTLCTVEADAGQIMRDVQQTRGPKGQYYYQRDYDVILSFGLTELKAQLSWIEKGMEKRSPATVVYDMPNS